MLRRNVHLLAQARHDPGARCEVGRRYLLGVEGMPRHVETGIGYLAHVSLSTKHEAATIICECLSLDELIAHRQEGVLWRAANAGSADAQFKLAVWLCLRHGKTNEAARWLATAAAAGYGPARRASTALAGRADGDGVAELARSIAARGDIEIVPVATRAAEELAQEGNLDRMTQGLHVVLSVASRLTVPLARLVVQVVNLCEQSGRLPEGIDAARVEACLDLMVSEGDHTAEYLLGRALCGIACGSVAPSSLASDGNLRKGAALLLRAADGGCHDAWTQLYRVHSDHRSSVANPQMARFFLEKAAVTGSAEAQRRLGALILRSASELKESEFAVQWLHRAAGQGDAIAYQLLQTLVLPIAGDDREADQAIELVRRGDPWLAARMRISRDFGLTKLEALCVDPIDGQRPWGLVVGKNRFVEQSKRAAPRAVPALHQSALDHLQRATLLFEQAQRDGGLLEGDWHRRSLHQRRVFANNRIAEEIFFAQANSAALDALRQGTKWARRVRPSLRLALSC